MQAIVPVPLITTSILNGKTFLNFNLKSKTIEHYKGLLNTPNLWYINKVFDIYQINFNHKTYPFINSNFNQIRLGKLVEELLNFQFTQLEDIKVIAKNLQISKNKITIGELDFLINKNSKTIHLEVIYKFYLYDNTIKSDNDLEKWIGPNRKDTLIYKLNKLKNKQLALLHSTQCKTILENLDLNYRAIKQYVCFKAQLFLPYNFNEKLITSLNKNCIVGFYISVKDVGQLSDYKFYIPEKLDWLNVPNHNVDWLSFDNSLLKLNAILSEKRSPLVWLKDANSNLQKCFITYW